MSYKYLRCRKSDGLLISKTFENDPTKLNHTNIYWIKVQDDVQGNFNLPETPTSKNDNVKFVPTVSLTQSETNAKGLIKDNSDGTWSHTLTSTQDLSARIGAILKQLSEEFTNYIQSKIPLSNQITFLYLLAESVDKNYTNRKSNMNAIGTWIKECLDYYYTQYDLIAASSDPESITWDFTTLDATLPTHNIRDNYKKND